MEGVNVFLYLSFLFLLVIFGRSGKAIGDIGMALVIPGFCAYGTVEPPGGLHHYMWSCVRVFSNLTTCTTRFGELVFFTFVPSHEGEWGFSTS